MSVVGSTAVRRCHVCIDAPLSRPAEIRCPDCGLMLFKVMEWAEGAVKAQCRRCKDNDREYKIWIFVFHITTRDFVDAVRIESTTIDLSSVIEQSMVE